MKYGKEEKTSTNTHSTIIKRAFQVGYGLFSFTFQSSYLSVNYYWVRKPHFLKFGGKLVYLNGNNAAEGENNILKVC